MRSLTDSATPTHTPASASVVARLHGEPLHELPKDLYIPPDALEIILEAFEGPLDLLLYLIRKANIDILDIPMAPLTEQYLRYVDAMRASRLELAAEYLLMAAMLLDIKSRMLLPRPPAQAAEEEADPRAELVRRLAEYEQMKRAAQMLDELPRVGRDYEWVGVLVAERVIERLPEVSLHDLQLAWLAVMRRARLFQHHTIGQETLSVREQMSHILRRFEGAPHALLAFETLFDVEHNSRTALVVTFLALLELAKEGLLDIVQREAAAPIFVKRILDADTTTRHA